MMKGMLHCLVRNLQGHIDIYNLFVGEIFLLIWHIFSHAVWDEFVFEKQK